MNFPVRIVHDLHGAMHVYDAGELEKHQKLGWKMDAPKVEEPVVPKKVGRPKKVPNA